MNKIGMSLLKKMRKKAKLPIITKPAAVLKSEPFAVKMFQKEVQATDLYVLAYNDVNERFGGREWLESPRIII